MRSIIAQDAQSALPIPAQGPHPRLDRIAAATLEQLSTALLFLSIFDADAFDHAMDVTQSDDDENRRHRRSRTRLPTCGGQIGIFLDRGLAWQHYKGDGTTAGQQQIYDPGHAPAVTWHLAEDLSRRRTGSRHASGAPFRILRGAPLACEDGPPLWPWAIGQQTAAQLPRATS